MTLEIDFRIHIYLYLLSYCVAFTLHLCPRLCPCPYPNKKMKYILIFGQGQGQGYELMCVQHTKTLGYLTFDHLPVEIRLFSQHKRDNVQG